MARADLLLKLVRSGALGNQAQFRKVVEALAAEERAKNHTILADRLLAQLRLNGSERLKPPTISSIKTYPDHLVVELTPKKQLEDLILQPVTQSAINELVEEQFRADLLRTYNLEPRHRILLAGPPGNGKTSLAEAIANALNVPFLVVRYESIIGSYLGETAQRIERVFDYARSRNCVLFFDEFDAIGKERGDLHETGEIKRVVSSLLLQIDSLPSYVIVVTASNHPELLDRAVWRRFQLRLELPMPTQRQIEEWFLRFEKRTEISLGLAPQYLAQQLIKLSFAEIEEFGTDVLRRIVLEQPNANTQLVTEQRLKQWRQRFVLANVDVRNEGC